MSLTCEEELHWVVRVVDNLSETVKVAEEEVCTLVSSESACETDSEGVRIDLVYDRHDARRVALVLEPVFLEGHLDVVDELSLESQARVPDLLVWHIVDCLPNLLVRLVCKVILVEVLGVYRLPLRSSPCWHVHTVCDIAYIVELLWEVASPDAVEHVL